MVVEIPFGTEAFVEAHAIPGRPEERAEGLARVCARMPDEQEEWSPSQKRWFLRPVSWRKGSTAVSRARRPRGLTIMARCACWKNSWSCQVRLKRTSFSRRASPLTFFYAVTTSAATSRLVNRSSVRRACVDSEPTRFCGSMEPRFKTLPAVLVSPSGTPGESVRTNCRKRRWYVVWRSTSQTLRHSGE